jgi:uroporphyrinogen decarboxylase
LKNINNSICDFVSIDWHISLPEARKLVDNGVGLQGNMDPRIFYYEFDTIKKYLNSLNEFGSKNSNWIFNLGHGFLPDIDHLKVKKTVQWIKKNNWNR